MDDYWKPKIGEKIFLKTLKELKGTKGLEHVTNRDDLDWLDGKVLIVSRILCTGYTRGPRRYAVISANHDGEEVVSRRTSDSFRKVK